MSTTLNIMSYRYGHLAAAAIESAIYQSGKRFNTIRFYDDGAGDCTHLPNIYPEVEFFLRRHNLGIIQNFNDALTRTTTTHVMFLGADNWLHPETLKRVSAVKADIVSYPAWRVGLGPYDRWEPGVPHGSSFYNVEKAKAVGMYAHSGNEHSEEDSVLFAKMREAGATYEVCETEPLLYYRWRHRMNFNQGM